MAQPEHMATNLNTSPLEPGTGPSETPVPVPDHQLLRCIGQGSYGEVWLARNLMGAYRAVKLVFRKSFDHERPFERELAGIQKFEPISRAHKGFVDILHVGRDERTDCFYYVMELGDDRQTGPQIDPPVYQPKTLTSLLAERDRLPVAECVRLGINLADALQFLHEHGLIHRDIKPSNVIFVNGLPKLADIGLVTGIGDVRSYVGTEGFVPPEGPGTPQADVFSLGMVLYELSTGKDRRDFPTLPEDLHAAADAGQFAELNEVMLRACHSDPKHRYASAQALLADLMVLQNGQSVQRLRSLERWLTLAKKAAILGAVVAVALTAVIYPMIARSNLQRDLRERQIGGSVSAGIGALGEGQMTEALAQFAEALRLTEGHEGQEQDQRLRCSTVLAFCPKLTQFEHLPAKSKWVEFTPDGRALLPTVWKGAAGLWDLERGAFTGSEFSLPEGLEMARLSADGRWVVAAGMQTSVGLWEVATGQRKQLWPHPAKVFAATFNHDGTLVATAGRDHKARVWDCQSGVLRAELAGHTDAILAVCFSRDGQRIATASRDRTVRLWNVATAQPLGTVMEHPNWVYSAAFSPDGKRLVTACFDRKARIWEAETRRFLPPALNHEDAVTSAEFSPDGRWLVTASMDGTARLWDVETQQPIRVNPVLRHSSRVLHAAFAPDGHRLATVCNDGTLRVWDFAANRLIPQMVRDDFSPEGGWRIATSNQWIHLVDAKQKAQPLFRLSGAGLKTNLFSPDGNWLLAVAEGASASWELQMWNTRTLQPAMKPVRLPEPPTGLALAANGTRWAVCQGAIARVCEVSSGQLASAGISPGGVIEHIQFSPDGQILLVQTERRLWLFESASGRKLAGPLAHPDRITHAEFSPTGDRLVSAFADNQINEAVARIWSVPAGQPIGQPMRHDDGILWAAFSPDGRRIVTASEDFTARVWDASSGSPLTPALRHEDQVQCARFSPDGRWIVTASTDKSARIWNAQTGEPLTPPLRHPSILGHARLLADGRQMVAGLNTERAWLWQLAMKPSPAEEMVALANLLIGRLPDADASSGMDQATAGHRHKQIWEQLKSANSATFAVTIEEREFWHLALADRAEVQRHWPLACFHLERLAKLRPANQIYENRLRQAQRQLAPRIATQ